MPAPVSCEPPGGHRLGLVSPDSSCCTAPPPPAAAVAADPAPRPSRAVTPPAPLSCADAVHLSPSDVRPRSSVPPSLDLSVAPTSPRSPCQQPLTPAKPQAPGALGCVCAPCSPRCSHLQAQLDLGSMIEIILCVVCGAKHRQGRGLHRRPSWASTWARVVAGALSSLRPGPLAPSNPARPTPSLLKTLIASVQLPSLRCGRGPCRLFHGPSPRKPPQPARLTPRSWEW